MSLSLYNPLQYIKSAYKNIIHPETKGNYPLLERCVAYVLPTVAAGTALYFGDKNSKVHNSSIYNVPAAIAGYIASQFALTTIKPHVTNMNDGIAKSFANFTVEQLDIVNDFLVLLPAYNILPQHFVMHKVFAFDVMPEILKGIESDLKNWWNEKDYESEVAGRIYASGIAGGISRNAASYLTNTLGGKKVNFTVEDLKQTQSDLVGLSDGDQVKKMNEQVKKMNEHSETNFSINNQNELLETLIRSSFSAIGKKALIGKGYQKSEVMQDFTEGLATSILAGSHLLKGIEGKLQGGIFADGACITAGICGVSLIKYLLSAIETPETSELDDVDPISPIPIMSEL